jgi:hypothetical protein
MKSKLLLISIEMFVFLGILVPTEILSSLLQMSRPEGMALAMLLSVNFYTKLRSHLRAKFNV